MARALNVDDVISVIMVSSRGSTWPAGGRRADRGNFARGQNERPVVGADKAPAGRRREPVEVSFLDELVDGALRFSEGRPEAEDFFMLLDELPDGGSDLDIAGRVEGGAQDLKNLCR